MQNNEAAHQKQISLPEEICFGDAEKLAPILEHFYSLKYDDEPNYNRILFMFQKLLDFYGTKGL